jgi:hypothetical protein
MMVPTHSVFGFMAATIHVGWVEVGLLPVHYAYWLGFSGRGIATKATPRSPSPLSTVAFP